MSTQSFNALRGLVLLLSASMLGACNTGYVRGEGGYATQPTPLGSTSSGQALIKPEKVADRHETGGTENASAAAYAAGTTAYRNGDIDAAQRYFEQAIETEPNNVKARYNLSMVYLSQAAEQLRLYVANSQDAERRLVSSQMLGVLSQLARAGGNRYANNSAQ